MKIWRSVLLLLYLMFLVTSLLAASRSSKKKKKGKNATGRKADGDKWSGGDSSVGTTKCVTIKPTRTPTASVKRKSSNGRRTPTTTPTATKSSSNDRSNAPTTTPTVKRSSSTDRRTPTPTATKSSSNDRSNAPTPTPTVKRSSSTDRSTTHNTKKITNITTPKLPKTTKPTKKTNKVNKALKRLSEKKINKNNAKEVAQNLTKVFKQSRPKDLSKDDADVAASIVETIVSIKERLNETADDVVDFIDTFMDMNKTILAESRAAATIIKALDTLVANVPLDEGTTSKQINKTNIVIQANEVKSKTFRGIGFGIKTNKRTRSTEYNTLSQEEHKSSIFIQLPQGVLLNMTFARIGFIYYANNKLFQANFSEEGEPSQTVLSSSVYGANISNLIEPVRITLPRRDGDKTAQCVFWDVSARQWSNFGCSLCAKQESNDRVECCCNHLTSFAVLFSPVKRKLSADDDVHAKVLSIISYVGCIISIIGVGFTFLTYSIFRHLRKTNQQPILMNLCVAIALLLIVFVAGVNSTNNRLGCQIVAVLLHYFTLVTVLWMGIEAYNLYLQIVKVMAIYQRKFMLKAAVVGWGVPLLIVLATLTAAIIQYKQTGGTTAFYYGNSDVCVLHNQLYSMISWFGPVLAILAMNLVAFCFIIYKLSTRHIMLRMATKSKHIKNCWTAMAIMVLLGLTWLFGALAIADARIVFEYLFCIFNSLQGFFIFFFHCVRIKEVRNQWSFFVSGLGFSPGESEHSQQRSRGMEKLRKDSDSIGTYKVNNGYYGQDVEQPKRKVTVVTMVGDPSELDAARRHSSNSSRNSSSNNSRHSSSNSRYSSNNSRHSSNSSRHSSNRQHSCSSERSNNETQF